ncbi:DUF4352 domain-containing protein [Nocardia sp. NPDC020380]|uniref:DUF4352 domain-containing protein n=1 Tax=Nocardia sp. NPDC020380 TaxID=3364309 RepID=UPI0037AD3E25
MNDPRMPQQPWQGGGPQPAPGYPPAPPRKRRVWPWVLFGVFACIALLFGGCVALVGGAAHEVAKQEAQSTSVAPVGSEVRDGKFAFTVNSVDAPVSSVGDNEFMAKQAQGEYILVHVTIANIGDQSQTYIGNNQKLIDDQGKSYSDDSAAEMNLNKDIVTDINPGNKVAVALAFDVPKGTVPNAIEFHDSMFSGGVRVALK